MRIMKIGRFEKRSEEEQQTLKQELSHLRVSSTEIL